MQELPRKEWRQSYQSIQNSPSFFSLFVFAPHTGSSLFSAAPLRQVLCSQWRFLHPPLGLTRASAWPTAGTHVGNASPPAHHSCRRPSRSPTSLLARQRQSMLCWRLGWVLVGCTTLTGNSFCAGATHTGSRVWPTFGPAHLQHSLYPSFRRDIKTVHNIPDMLYIKN